MNTSTLVQKLWNCCNVLRDDGMSHGDYVEQPTYLLFLKMADMAERGALDGYCRGRIGVGIANRRALRSKRVGFASWRQL